MEDAEYGRMDAAEGRMWWYRALHARLEAALSGVAGPLLDAGCGTGGLLHVLGRDDSVGIEWNPSAAARAAAKSGRPVAAARVQALPFQGHSFGAAVLADVLSHEAVDPARALAELHRVLRPGGLLVVNMPAFAWLLSAHDRRVRNARRLSAPALCRLLAAAGFQVRQARYWNGLLLPLMAARRKLGTRSRSDVSIPPAWLDRLLFAVTELERALPPLPAGGSVLAVAQALPC